LSLAVFLFAHWQGFVNPYAINDDVRQQVYWMQRYADRDLYPKTLLNDYAEAYVTLGVNLCYEAASWVGTRLGAFDQSDASDKSGKAPGSGLAGSLGSSGAAPARGASGSSGTAPDSGAASGTPTGSLSSASPGAPASPSPVRTVNFFNPVQFTKILSGILFLCQCLAMFALGHVFGGRPQAWAMAAMAWLMPFFLENISGGLARAFASPLLALAALALLRHRPGSVSTLALGGCIPYIYLPCAPAIFLAAIQRFRINSEGSSKLKLILTLLVLLLATGMAYLNGIKPQDQGFGPLVSLAEATGRPEFGPEGRLDLVPLPSPFLDVVYYPFERIGLFKEYGLIPGIISLVLLVPLLYFGARAVNWRALASSLKPLAVLGGSFLAFYIAARLMAFTLFVPDRYMQYPVNLLYAILLSACLAGAVTRLKPGKSAAVCLILAVAALGALRLKDVALYDYSADAPLYAAVEAATPKNAMLAGHPELMDNVMTFARRNALATFELAHPWSRGFWSQLSPRLDGFFAAYYASDADTVVRFARESGVDFLVVDEAHFTIEFLAAKPFFEPFGAAIKALTQGRDLRTGGFAVLDTSRFPRIPLRPGAFLIDLRPFRDGSSSQLRQG
jgi:hypothetical protein